LAAPSVTPPMSTFLVYRSMKLALVFAGLGFAIHALWIIAVILFVCWIVGFALGKGRRSAHT
jgi:hypothetical protein